MSAFTDALNGTVVTKTVKKASPFMDALGVTPEQFNSPNVKPAPLNPPSKSPFNPNTQGNAEFNTQLNQRTQGPVKTFFSGLANTFTPQNIQQTSQGIQNVVGLGQKQAQTFNIGENLTPAKTLNAKATITKSNLSQPTIPQTPTNMDLGKEAQTLARMTPRAVAEVTQSLFPSKNQNEVQPLTQSPIFRFLLGDETLKPLAQQTVETEQQLQDKGFGKASTPLAILGVAGNTALALSPLTAGLGKLANNAIANLAKEASTKELTITFADAQKIVNGDLSVAPEKLAAFKAAASEHPDLLRAFKSGGVTIAKTEETQISAFLKKISGGTPEEGVSYSIPDNKPFAQEIKPQGQLPGSVSEPAPFAHEVTPVEPKTAPETTITDKPAIVYRAQEKGTTGEFYTTDKAAADKYATLNKNPEIVTKDVSNLNLKEVSSKDMLNEKENPQTLKNYDGLTFVHPVTGTKDVVLFKTPSKIATSIEQKAIEQKLTQGFDGVAGYDKITIKDQAERAAKLMTDTEKAMSVIKGESPLPEGLRGTALITAAEEHIARTGDVRMAYELANSPLVSETSAAAQELRLAAERQPDNLTAKLQEIKKAKELVASKKFGDIKKARVKITNEVKAEIAKTTPKAKDWAGFLDELRCR